MALFADTGAYLLYANLPRLRFRGAFDTIPTQQRRLAQLASMAAGGAAPPGVDTVLREVAGRDGACRYGHHRLELTAPDRQTGLPRLRSGSQRDPGRQAEEILEVALAAAGRLCDRTQGDTSVERLAQTRARSASVATTRTAAARTRSRCSFDVMLTPPGRYCSALWRGEHRTPAGTHARPSAGAPSTSAA